LDADAGASWKSSGGCSVKVGDVVFVVHFHSIQAREQVVSLTRTQGALSNGWRFALRDGLVANHPGRVKVSTPELEERWARQNFGEFE
jgi:hypothetical protein